VLTTAPLQGVITGTTANLRGRASKVLIQTREQFVEAKTTLLDSELTAVDTETAGFDGRIIGISTHCAIRGRDGFEVSFYFPFRHEHDENLFKNVKNLPIEWLKELRSVFGRKDGKWIFHNFKFDLQKFWLEDIDFPGEVADTMLMSWMIDENTPNDLKGLGERFISDSAKFEQDHIKQLVKTLGTWESVPPDVMGMYAEKDAKLTYELYHKFVPMLQEQEMLPLLPTEMKFCRLLARMEYRGIRIDTEQAKQLAYETDCWLASTRETLGFDPSKKKDLAHKLFGRPPEGRGLKPLGLTKSKLASPILLSDGTSVDKIPMMDKAALSRYDDPLPALVLEYRSKQKALSTWFLGFLEKADTEGRLHTTFKQHGTVTTRLSSSNPNVQQIPRTTEEEQEAGLSKALVKTLFRPEDDCELWEFDYSQCEYRLAGCYAKEEAIIEGYAEGKDFHQLTADLLGISRQDAKTVNFAVLYGAGPRKLGEQLGVSEADGFRVLSEFREAYPRLTQVSREAEKAARRGWIRYWDGRRRHFQYSSEYHKAFNSVIQGGAARLMIQTMLRIEEAGYLPHLQVHDSLWFSIPKDGLEVHVKEIKRIMEWPSEQFPIEFPVDAKRLDHD